MVRENISRGRFFILSDNSLWQVDRFDRMDAAFWMRFEDVTVIHNGFNRAKLVNEDDVVEAKRLSGAALKTSIAGEFEGWDGDTVVKLIGGTIWKQSAYHYEYTYEYGPDVILYKNGYGISMLVDGTDEAVDVVQIR